MAKGNYWDTPCPDSTEILTCMVNANYFPALCTSPLGRARPGVEVEAVVEVVKPLVCTTGNIVRGEAELVVTSTSNQAWTEFRVYDVLGRLRSQIQLDGEQEGERRLAWNAVDRSGRRLPPGIYFATVAGRGSESKAIRLLVLHGGER